MRSRCDPQIFDKEFICFVGMLVKDGTYLPHDLTVIDGNDHVVVRVSQVSFEALGANCRIEHVLRYVFEYRLVPRLPVV